MQFLFWSTLVCLIAFVASAPPVSHLTDLAIRDYSSSSPSLEYNALEKRKGGGGGKGGGSSSSGSSGGRSSSGSSGSSSRPLSSYSFSPSSNVGGRTRDGSGTPKAYGNRYTGGAVVPYTAGARSPTRGIAPYAFPVAALAFFPGIWLYGTVWAYPYGIPYHWVHDGQNRTSNVTCLCQQYQVCGCDPTDNSTFLNEVVSNGTGQPVNSSLVRTVDYGNGTTATYINGSLANGTTADGGTDPSNESQISAGMRLAMSYGGYWVMVATVAMGTWIAV
ncbi:uncharacterized protein Z518_02154 [Rhinocladiella mackenziei CBS 650.93]|uniref:DUF7732 domain-containing protein n=1 Tax=Rhinocladiella mackenziei CBS 650.93 TaxID=1442369 RepID=A0A0D2IW81_9EURO|nr:uncharacterized protein Z518_02154 [Rhinocladiella mackenziei CBS 650.93]KIX07501.1 hypothetical protein Z518_02154 [Rhinocladiella mackenziei CBS 650.93]